jgi:formate C-acetyltransferase
MPIRRAKMLLHLVRHMPIAIDPDEVIVGNRSLYPRMGVIAPEGAVNWVDKELDTLPTRAQDPFNITPQQIKELREEIFPYWEGKTLEDTVQARLPAAIKAALRAKAFTLNQTDHAQGHILPDVAGWLRLGISGLRAQIVSARQTHQPLSPEQHNFYEAAALAVQAASEFVERFARLADDQRSEFVTFFELLLRCSHKIFVFAAVRAGS